MHESSDETQRLPVSDPHLHLTSFVHAHIYVFDRNPHAEPRKVTAHCENDSTAQPQAFRDGITAMFPVLKATGTIPPTRRPLSRKPPTRKPPTPEPTQ
jgi:hypothetical protein